MRRYVAVSLLALAPLCTASEPAAESVALIPLAEELPITRDTALRLGSGGSLDSQSSLALTEGGGFALVYGTSADTSERTATLMLALSPDGRHVAPPRRMDLVDAQLVGSASFVSLRDSSWLYFASAPSMKGELSLWRSAFNGTTFDAAQRLPAVDELGNMTGWPRWISAGNGLALSFRNRSSRPYWAVADDGQAFRPRMIEDIGQSYVRVIPMPGGGWFRSFQRPPKGGYMATYVSISADGQQWSKPEPIAWPDPPQRPDVHDAYALARRDRGVDLYYSYPINKGTPEAPVAGFNLYRRAVFGAGDMGPEQLLNEPSQFMPFCSSAHRLANGEVLLSFADIQKVVPGVGVEQAQLVVSRLPGDAPRN